MKTLTVFRHAFLFLRVRASTVSALAATFFASAALALDPPPGGWYSGQVTALGQEALLNYSSGGNTGDTALGYHALYNTITGSENTGVGNQVLLNNTEGGGNTGVGFDALYANTTGNYNVAIGEDALLSNTTALEGTAVGWGALESNTTGGGNTAVGFDAMTFSTGADNTAVGTTALAFNTTGIRNVAVGVGAMNMSGGGSNNVALGYAAGYTLLGTNNIVIGYNAASNLTRNNSNNNIEIGTAGTDRDANVIRLGDPALQKKTFIAGISGATLSGGAAVMVNNHGQLGVATSSARYKEDIQPMAKSSEAILSCNRSLSVTSRS